MLTISKFHNHNMIEVKIIGVPGDVYGIWLRYYAINVAWYTSNPAIYRIANA